MAKFQCNASKTIIEVFADHDINGMRHNPSYTELIEEQQEEVKPKKAVKKSVVFPQSGSLEEE